MPQIKIIRAALREIQRLPYSACEKVYEILRSLSQGIVSQIFDVKQRLLKRCETGYLYWDTYLALQLAGIEGSELYQWEKDAISHLNKHSNEYLKSELNHI